MNIERVRKQLEIDEGVVYEIYLDHLGYPTFGIGHLVSTRDDRRVWIKRCRNMQLSQTLG